MSFTQWTTKKGKLIARGATVAQIDIEAPKLGYQMPVQFAVLGDAKATAEALLAELDRRGASGAGRRDDRTRQRIRSGDNHHSPYPEESSAQYIDPRTVSKAVDEILPGDRVVASDSDISADGFRAIFAFPIRRRPVSAIRSSRWDSGLPPRSVLPSQIRASSRCLARATAAS